jgi:hypothetical protein
MDPRIPGGPCAAVATGFTPWVGGHGGGIAPILGDVDPLAPLRSVGDRLAPPMEALAQSIADRAISLVLDAVDVNAVLDRVDIEEILDRVDMNRLLARIDVNQLLSTVDVNPLVGKVDVTAIVAQVDVNQIVQQVDVNEVMSKVDVDAVVDRVDMNGIVERIDLDAIVEQTDLGSIIAKSSSGVASGVVDAVRSRTVGVDESIARVVARLRRRPYAGPPGPPTGLRATAAS